MKLLTRLRIISNHRALGDWCCQCQKQMANFYHVPSHCKHGPNTGATQLSWYILTITIWAIAAKQDSDQYKWQWTNDLWQRLETIRVVTKSSKAGPLWRWDKILVSLLQTFTTVAPKRGRCQWLSFWQKLRHNLSLSHYTGGSTIGLTETIWQTMDTAKHD